MRWTSIFAMAFCASLVASIAHAQCNRGGRISSTGGGVVGPLLSTTARANVLSAVAMNARLNSQLAQQRYLQAMAQRQELARRIRSQQASEEEALVSNRGDARRERLRQRNAEKALAAAIKADQSGRLRAAEKHYRRVVQIVGVDGDVGSQARRAIEELELRRAAQRPSMTKLASAR